MSDDFVPNSTELVANNIERAAAFTDGSMPGPPARHLAIVTCMDARLDPLRFLGIEIGDAHVVRNAGGLVTDDVIRSLALSQRFLGTREIMVIQHTRCGVQGLDDDVLANDLEADTGRAPTWRGGGFADAHVSVSDSLERLRTCPFLPHIDHIGGFVYDVDDGLLHAVES